MGTAVVRSADFAEGYRIIRTGDSLFIMAIGDHARPLRLRGERLASLGLRLEGGRHFSGCAANREAERLAAWQSRFVVGILILALAILLLVPVVVSGW